jgi:carbohydrate diacid regulator
MNRLSKVLDKIKTTTGVELMFKPLNGDVGESFFRSEGYSYFVFYMGEEYVYGYFKTIDGDETLAKLFAGMLEEAAKDDYEKLSRVEKLRLLFLGELSESRQSELKAQYTQDAVYATGFFTDSVIKQRELIEYLGFISREGDYYVVIDNSCVMLFSLSTGEYKSAYEFARVMYENIKEELRINLCVSSAGELRSFDDFALSYKRAVKAYETGKKLSADKTVFAYHFYAVAYALENLETSELSALLSALTPYSQSKAWEDAELIETGEEFVSSSLNVSETSRILYIHRNTLMYRLDKIEKEIGLDIREFADASAFKLILTIKRLLTAK